MIGQRYRKALMVVALVMFSCLVSISMWGQRDCCEGESWLKWTQEHRDAYVAGYVEGYYGGYLHGCQEGTRHASAPIQAGLDNFPLNKCLDRKWDFSKGIDLSRAVTAFYKRYPENRNLLIKEVLEELGKGRSIEDIHQHPPFPVHKISQDGEKSGQVK